jgi:hypothetical protein
MTSDAQALAGDDRERRSAMSMAEEAPAAEARWPVALVIVLVLGLLDVLPGRVRLFPPWVLYVVGVGVLTPLLGVAMRHQSVAWARIERAVSFVFIMFAFSCNLMMLLELIFDMVRRSQTVNGLQLLTSSIALWAMNVLMFSLLYWQLDRGGPNQRVNGPEQRPDWLFPQDQAPPEMIKPGWRPKFIDYLFLGFSTATAFSTTDAMPLRSRAKLAMMFESSISLVTLVVVAARAINVLGA